MMLSRITLSILCVVLFALNSSFAADDCVSHICHNFPERTANRLVQQVHRFNKQVLLYKAYASYFDRADMDLPGFNKFFLHRSKVVQELADNMTSMVNERGGHVTFSTIQLINVCTDISRQMGKFPHACYFVLSKGARQKTLRKEKTGKKKKVRKFKAPFYKIKTKPITAVRPTALDCLEDSIIMERIVNQDFIHLTKYIIRIHDPPTRRKLEDYMEVQLTIIEYLANLITRLGLYEDQDNYALGEYILDSELTYP